MTKAGKYLCSGLCALLTLTAGSSALVAQEDEADSTAPARAWSIQYDYLHRNLAQAVVLEICAEEPDCQIRSISGGPHGGRVSVSASPAMQARIGRELARLDNVGSTHRFQVAVVEATREGEHQLGGLSDGARVALEDVATLLPYKGLVLRDVALIETSDVAETRLAGPRGLHYHVGLRMRPVVTQEGLSLIVDRFHLSRGAQNAPDGESVGAADIIRTSFEVAAGETTVVGTSRINGGDAALIVLVTAVEDEVGG